VSEDEHISLKAAYAMGLIIIILFGAVVYLSVSIISINNNGSYFNAYVSTHGNTNDDYNTLLGIVNFTQATVLLSNQTVSNTVGRSTDLAMTNPVPYAGLIKVQVNSLTNNNNTIVRMSYSSNNTLYGSFISANAQSVGVGGTAAFTVLPTTDLTFSFGTVDNSAASEVVTITYYY